MTQEQIDHRVEKMLDHLESQLFAGTMTPKDFASNVADLHRWEATQQDKAQERNMTRHDYVLLAWTLRGTKPDVDVTGYFNRKQQWDLTVSAMTDALAHANPNFDRTRFRDECGAAR